MLRMVDDAGPDAKIICVPANDPRWDGVHAADDLPEGLLPEIEHFFEVYKTLEPGKHATIEGYADAEDAWREIDAAFSRARTSRRER